MSAAEDRADRIKTVGVIGTGQMGTGISHVFALAGYGALVYDIDPARAEKSLATTEHNLGRQVARDIISEDDKAAALKRLHAVSDMAGLADCDLIIEAVTEDEGVKRETLKKIIAIAKPDALLATNTSSISVTRLGAVSGRPGKFMGMHFMNPVPVMKLVELVRGLATDDDTFQTIRAISIRLGKTPVNAEDFPAFMVNRILLPMINEAVYTLYEGVGSVDAIDTAMRLGANHPMGPLELADFIGLDVCLSVMHVLYDGLADTKYRPCPLLVKYVEAGWLGRKTGRGFYDYTGDHPVPTR